MSARPPEGVETWTVYVCPECGERAIRTAPNGAIVCLGPAGGPAHSLRTARHVEVVRLSALLAEREAKERAERDALEWKLACGQRDEDADKDVLTVVRERDAAVARAEQAERDRAEALLCQLDLATYIEQAVGKANLLVPVSGMEAIEVDLDKAQQRAEQAEAELAAFAEDHQAALRAERLPRERAEAERDELRKKLRDGNDEGTSTTAEAAREVSRESRNRK